MVQIKRTLSRLPPPLPPENVRIRKKLPRPNQIGKHYCMQRAPQSTRTRNTLITLVTFWNQGFVGQRGWTEHTFKCRYLVSNYKFCPRLTFFWRRKSVVDIVTGQRIGQPRHRISNPLRSDRFFSSPSPHRLHNQPGKGGRGRFGRG